MIAFDPGLTMGWAIFRDGLLEEAGHVTRTSIDSGRWKFPDGTGAIVVVERPMHYPNGRNKSRPNDLITLAIFAGEIIGRYRASARLLELVTPAEWKGQVPKEVCHNRLEKIRNIQEVFPENHNALDAVGIGMWYVGRYRK